MDSFKTFITFLKNNKFLVLVFTLIVALTIMVIVTKDKLSYTVDLTKQESYETITSTNKFTYYRLDSKYYVLVKVPGIADKEIIKNTLGIPYYIDFEIVYPNALNPNLIIEDQDEKIEPSIPEGSNLYD